ncbi:hypothetical protein RF11_09515 [Thelohanellus kitauei]|uniref:Uncharacterized protein n=1 Tax=Thelohanellus kitauei TaxID=669202 RepID=A0A0C2MWL9_THEKT|nr:hypothetical protein RF11_09515 [Thelohanellus kitauei]
MPVEQEKFSSSGTKRWQVFHVLIKAFIRWFNRCIDFYTCHCQINLVNNKLMATNVNTRYDHLSPGSPTISYLHCGRETKVSPEGIEPTPHRCLLSDPQLFNSALSTLRSLCRGSGRRTGIGDHTAETKFNVKGNSRRNRTDPSSMLIECSLTVTLSALYVGKDVYLGDTRSSENIHFYQRRYGIT